MQKTILKISAICFSIFLVSCNGEGKKEEAKTSTTNTSATSKTDTTGISKDTSTVLIKGDYCFLKAENKDSTTVKIRILSDDDIRGEMIWNPYQKDGAIGTLTGKMISKNEMKLAYNYTIEGNRQSEEKIFKIEGEKLSIKEGELTDPKKDGNSVFKDIAKTTYTGSEVLNKINCK